MEQMVGYKLLGVTINNSLSGIIIFTVVTSKAARIFGSARNSKAQEYPRLI